MKIELLLKYLKCPCCNAEDLQKDGKKINCRICSNVFDITEGVPILIEKENLGLQESKQLVFFDKHYSDFSRDEYSLENWRLSMVNRIFDPVVNEKINTYLDIGCGATGYTVIEAAKRNNWLSFGADISLEAMLRANNLAKKQGLGDMTAFFVCSAQNLPFQKSSFDYISAVSLLEHLDNDKKTIENIHKILKESGYFYVCVPNSYKNIWPFLWPLYYYFDHKVGHKRHYSSKNIISKMQKNKLFKLKKLYYNGHLIKLWQLFLEKINLIDDKYWWQLEKKDINKNPSGMQLNAIFQKG